LKNIAVLLTSFNRKDITLLCLHTLQAQVGLDEHYSLDIFLVDDGSTDGTGEAVRIQFADVNIIEGTGDLYWNRGMHLAWKTAVETNKEFDYYMWLNDDVVLYENAIMHLLDCAEQSDRKGIVCGVFEETKDSGNISYGGGNLIGKSYVSNKLHSKNLQPCGILNGNCVLIPKSVYKVVGLIDPIFPHALGDHDYGLRALKLNQISYTTKEIIGVCKRNVSLPKWCKPEVPFTERIRFLYSPLGNSHPYYYTVYYVYRHYGFYKAIKNFISIHLRVVFPNIWK
jgi:GT2 family glycosyltransferase